MYKKHSFKVLISGKARTSSSSGLKVLPNTPKKDTPGYNFSPFLNSDSFNPFVYPNTLPRDFMFSFGSGTEEQDEEETL